MINKLKVPKPDVTLALFNITPLNSTFYEYDVVLSEKRNFKHRQIFNRGLPIQISEHTKVNRRC